MFAERRSFEQRTYGELTYRVLPLVDSNRVGTTTSFVGSARCGLATSGSSGDRSESVVLSAAAVDTEFESEVVVRSTCSRCAVIQAGLVRVGAESIDALVADQALLGGRIRSNVAALVVGIGECSN